MQSYKDENVVSIMAWCVYQRILILVEKLHMYEVADFFHTKGNFWGYNWKPPTMLLTTTMQSNGWDFKTYIHKVDMIPFFCMLHFEGELSKHKIYLQWYHKVTWFCFWFHKHIEDQCKTFGCLSLESSKPDKLTPNQNQGNTQSQILHALWENEQLSEG